MTSEPLRRALLICVLALLPAASALAQKGGPGWQPETTTGKFDWIRLDSGEWLGGKLLALYDDVLEFDSDKMGYKSFEWEDVLEVRTAQVMEIWLLGGISARGKLVIEGKRVLVKDGDKEEQFERAELVNIAAGAATELSRWTANVTLGGNLRRGNTDQSEYNFKAEVKRRTVRSRLIFDALSNYSATFDERTSDNHRFDATWDQFMTDRFFLRPIFAEYYRDAFQNIAHRATLGTGVGYTVAETPRTCWDVIGGPGVQWTWYETVEADEDDEVTTPAFVLSTTLEIEVTEWMDFDFEYRITATDDESGKYAHHSLATFDTELTSKLDFTVSFVWDRIAEPRPDETGAIPEKDDFRLSVGLTFDL
jgi:putative salt-induced outer membrane protein YdiY